MILACKLAIGARVCLVWRDMTTGPSVFHRQAWDAVDACICLSPRARFRRHWWESTGTQTMVRPRDTVEVLQEPGFVLSWTDHIETESAQLVVCEPTR
jgi:hypothetical protein